MLQSGAYYSHNILFSYLIPPQHYIIHNSDSFFGGWEGERQGRSGKGRARGIWGYREAVLTYGLRGSSGKTTTAAVATASSFKGPTHRQACIRTNSNINESMKHLKLQTQVLKLYIYIYIYINKEPNMICVKGINFTVQAMSIEERT